MDSLHIDTNNHFIKKEVSTVNRCRLYLQVVTAADICNAKGSEFTKSAIFGRRDKSRQSKCMWTTQRRPLERELDIWSLCIKICWRPKLNELLNLGNWKSSVHQKHKWWYCRSNKGVYNYTDNGYSKFCHQSGGVTRLDKLKVGFQNKVSSMPELWESASVLQLDCDTLIFDGSSATMENTTSLTSNSWSNEIMVRQSPMVQELLQYSYIKGDGSELLKLLLSGTLKIVSDVSYHPVLLAGTISYRCETFKRWSSYKDYAVR